MPFVSLLLLLAAPPMSILGDDKTFLAHLHQAVSHMSDKKVSFVRFEKAVGKSDAVRCRRILSHAAPNSTAYAECAFVQAYYGMDYEHNIARLLRPYRLWREKSNQWGKEYSLGEDLNQFTTLYGLVIALNLLYLKHHDLKSLGAWEDLQLDGDYSENSDEELGKLWQRHAPDMLRAAYGHPQRITNLADSLSFPNAEEDDKNYIAMTIEDVRPYLHSKDAHVAMVAQRLLRDLRNRNH